MIPVNPRIPRLFRRGTTVLLLALAVGGCNMMNQTVVISGAGRANDIRDMLPKTKDTHGAAYELSQGVAALLAGHRDAAAAHFNLGLKYDPKDPNLHFLNALVYNLRAAAGDTTRYDLAEVGYKLALKFDPNHWLAAYQLGKLYLAENRDREARDAFARTLQIEPGNASAAYGLAVASYALGEPAAARAALQRLPRADRNRAPVLRANALTEAALGDAGAAQRFLDDYRKAGTTAWRVRQVARRIESWGSFHRRNDGRLAQNMPYMGLPPTDTPSTPTAPTPVTPPPPTPVTPAPASPPPGAASSDNASPPSANDARPTAGTPAKAASAPPRKMVILDAIIINREKSLTSQTGVNLLNGLSVMFSGNLLDYARNRTEDNRTDSSSTNTQQINNSLTISLPAVTYSLNVANAKDSNNRLLARPSVLAYDRTQSNLFVGTELTYTTSGDTGGNSYNKEVGLKLQATPVFLQNGLLKITVDTEFDAFAPTAAPGTFQQAVATVKTSSHVVAEMNFGQTLVIGAGSSQRSSKESNGVPVLRDIPLLKHLFNVNSGSKQETSVLILITPRRPAYIDRKTGKLTDLAGRDTAGASSLDALQKTYGGYWRPTSNTLRAMYGLDHPPVLDEFRRGDIHFLDLDNSLSMDGSKKDPGPSGIVRTLVENMYF